MSVKTLSVLGRLRVLISLILVFLLTGCGANSIKASRDTDLLHIQPQGGFSCPWQPNDKGSPNNLVLATSRLTYTSGEIQQMRLYWGKGKPIPKTLHWVPAGPQCGGIWEITNTGSTTLHIPSVTMQLTAVPHVNNTQYHLVDTCTLIPPPDCFGSHGNGPGACSPYYAIFYLHPGKIEEAFTAIPVSPTCGELNLDPNDTVELLLLFYPGSNSPKNLVYNVMPRLSFSMSNTHRTLALSQFDSTLTFASANQLICYGLQGATFTAENPQPPPTSKTHFCVNQYIKYMPH